LNRKRYGYKFRGFYFCDFIQLHVKSYINIKF